MTSAQRRQLAVTAINNVLAGALARDIETEVVDFKEETGTRGPGGARAPRAAT